MRVRLRMIQMNGIVLFSSLGAYCGWILVYFILQQRRVMSRKSQLVVFIQYALVFFLLHLASEHRGITQALKVIETISFILAFLASAFLTYKLAPRKPK